MRLHTYPFSAMGSPCELRLYADDPSRAAGAAGAAEAEVRRLEARYSRYRDDSETTRINRSAGSGAGVEVDGETAALLDYAQTAWEQSEGLFDISSGVLRRAWDFSAARLPGQAELDALLPRVGWQHLRWLRPRLHLAAGMELDFGGYVKEYAADCAAGACRAAGIHHGFVDLGGDIAVIGPHPDGMPWQVGVRNPRDPAQAIATVELASGAIASSGDYERFFEHDGRRYCHILNPLTGWPAQGLRGVSVVAPQCLVAGTASTVAMLKGPEAGPRWLDSLGLAYLVVDAGGRPGGTLLSAS
jgi:thiamine biosynthesis lipoprotein